MDNSLSGKYNLMTHIVLDLEQLYLKSNCIAFHEKHLKKLLRNSPFLWMLLNLVETFGMIMRTEFNQKDNIINLIRATKI